MLSLRGFMFAVAAASACLATSAPVSAALFKYVFEPGTSACFDPIFDKGSPCQGDSIWISGSFNLDTDRLKQGEPPQDVKVTLSNIMGNLLPPSPVRLTSGSST